MSAIDSDEQAEFKRFTYQISDGNEVGNFRIDPDSGWVTTATRLDREESQSHSFTVVAIDSGFPQKTGEKYCRVRKGNRKQVEVTVELLYGSVKLCKASRDGAKGKKRL